MHFAKSTKASRRNFLFKSSLSGLGLGLMSNRLFGYSSEKMNDLEINAPGECSSHRASKLPCL